MRPVAVPTSSSSGMGMTARPRRHHRRWSTSSFGTWLPARRGGTRSTSTTAARVLLASLRGIVARDIGSHAFVSHLSNGLAWEDCISHDTVDEPFWWDQREPGTRVSENQSHGIAYRRCVASKVAPKSGTAGHRLAGFSLEEGAGNLIEDCVAVGVAGSTDAAGFGWPEGAFIPWTFRRNISHNNAKHGIFTWQNTGRHDVGETVCYRMAPQA